MRVILASASPRRAALLRAAGFEFGIMAVDTDETVQPGEVPQAYVRRLAMEKSARAMEKQDVVSGFSRTGDARIVLAADTAVVIDGEILGKPRDDRDAAEMLRRLSGRRHEVMTGVSVRTAAAEAGRVEVTAVEFCGLSEADIAWYVASGEGRDKAGAYAIQGLASRFIPRIEGSYSSVVGLPVAMVHELVGLIASARHSGYSQR